MKFPTLKSRFRAAAFSGLAVLGLMTGCSRAPDTRLVFDDKTIYTSVDIDELKAWDNRQDLYLLNDSNRVHYDTWLAQLDHVMEASLLDKANAVNDLVNRDVFYLVDSVNYHTNEYFASGVETVLTGVGDCEDFAIAKLYALKYLGVPEDRMFLMAVNDDKFDTGPNHCVLVVDTTADNSWKNCLVLDNDEYFLGMKTGSLEKLGDTGYKPFFTLNTLRAHNCKLEILEP